MIRFAVFLCLIFSIYPQTASAWGSQGHQLICGLAEQQLSGKAKRWLDTTLALGEFLDGETGAFADACLWPDAARYSSHKDSYEQHFINVPASAAGIDLRRDCLALDCLPVGIRRSLVYLVQDSQGKREAARKAAALRYLGHFLGDLHQPLHVSHGEDWGGNKIAVSWFGESTNLHRIWDQHLLEKSSLNYPDSLAVLKQQLVRQPAYDDDLIGVMPWLTESLALTRQHAYRHPDGRLVKTDDALGQAYLSHNQALVSSQLILASQRLASLINQVADGRLTLQNLEARVWAPAP